MKKRNLRQNNSGQVIIITALLVVTLLLSTAIYIIETEKEVPVVGTNQISLFTGYEQSTRSTLISALANVTNGGNANVLNSDLNELSTAITSHSYQIMLQMGSAPLNTAPYQEGVWISWGLNGQGTSSAYVEFTFSSTASSTTSNLKYAVNVTSELNLKGYYTQNETLKQTNLTVNLLNEGKPALAQSYIFSFENSTDWVNVEAPNVVDFGNGTCLVSFNAATGQLGDPLPVSVICQDQRGITVRANITCNLIA